MRLIVVPTYPLLGFLHSSLALITETITEKMIFSLEQKIKKKLSLRALLSALLKVNHLVEKFQSLLDLLQIAQSP